MGFNLRKVFQAFQSIETPNSTDKTKPSSTATASFGYSNKQAIVEQVIQPNGRGRVRFWGSKWFARCNQEITIHPGEVVDVVDIENITLVVEPAFLLAPSKLSLTKVKQAWEQRHWGVENSTGGLDANSEPVQLLIAHSNGEISAAAAIDTWKRFIQGQPVYITKFKACCELLGLNWQEIVGYGSVRPTELVPPPIQVEPPIPLDPISEAEHSPNVDFVGRAEAIADLNRLVRSGARAIAILGEGGIGKTTLAQHYFQQGEFDLVLECWMAKHTQNISSAEGLVQTWLERYFHEEPAREFSAALEQLRHKLQDLSADRPLKIGVLIDNLEPALDRNGQIIEPHRDYVDLLEVLSDPTVRSLTLITSREPLREPSVNLCTYVLPGLDLAAWRQFFQNHQVQADAPMLEQIHQAYSGNAKAMTILSSTISLDFGGNLEAFWKEHHTDLLKATDLEALVASQFDRLQQLYPEAYRLLLRLGCYRYQSIATVPLEGLQCLLWDVPEVQHNHVIRFLEDLFLVEVKDGRYQLHPVIQAKAVSLLKASPDWELANRRAAECWTKQVKSVETIEDALTALQAYYHYLQIGDWDAAAGVLLYRRDSKWENQEPLGVSFYRLGLLRRMISAIVRVIDRIQPESGMGELYRILGDLYWLSGQIHRAIACHQKARDVAIAFQLKELEVVSLFNIGLCKIQLWELEEALALFQTVSEMAETADCHMYAVGSWFCLAFLHSCLGRKQEAMALIQKVSDEYSTLGSTSWGRGYSLLFLGSTLKNLGELDKANKMYDLARTYAQQSHYTQVKAGALNGLAALYRDRLDFQSAIANHLAARRLLERIEARADLAEVYYQLGLTYLKMNETAEGRLSLQKAIQLFQQMGAPKQVDKVQRALKSIT